MFTVGISVSLGGGSLGLGPTPAISGRVASSPHPAREEASRQSKTGRIVVRMRHPYGHHTSVTIQKPGSRRTVPWDELRFTVHAPFCFARIRLICAPPREGRAHAPDSHTTDRRDCVRRGPRHAARL